MAAIHGNALGGGLEVAMSCHYRVMAADAKVGQPEVLLGIIPGAGGTQRLPRLCGAEMAIEMCTAGKPVAAAKALSAGIVDQIAGANLLDDAIAFARSQAGASPQDARSFGEDRRSRGRRRRLRGRTNRAREDGAGASRRRSGRSMPSRAHSRSTSSAARRASASCSPTASPRTSRARWCTCSSPIVKPRRCRTCRKTRRWRRSRSAAVIGAGTMGGGIAMAYANAGIPVLLKDVDDAAVQKGMATIRKNYESTVAKGKMTAEAMAKTLSLITPTTTYDGFENVDIVVEAAFEDMNLKKTIFADLGRITKPSCILASNTSTLDIDEFAKASGRPQQVIGHHFFSPANVMKLLEIVRGKETEQGDDRDVAGAREEARQGRRRRRQLLRVRRQPDAGVLHARGAAAARRGRHGAADRQAR